MKQKLMFFVICFSAWSPAILPIRLFAQSAVNRDSVLVAAREIIRETTFCGLVTVDSTGQPQVRTMNPFPLKDDFIIWFATARLSRKVREIRNNPRVSVYYADHSAAKGYVNISGTATIIDDQKLLIEMQRAYWKNIPDWQNNFVLIKIVPGTIEVVNYKHGLTNEAKTLRAPIVVF
ncbi:MAG: pyridoxamine 5'-phosphate oxidase family protein [Candidatus Neomarinimicrobiota bacterium]